MSVIPVAIEREVKSTSRPRILGLLTSPMYAPEGAVPTPHVIPMKNLDTKSVMNKDSFVESGAIAIIIPEIAAQIPPISSVVLLPILSINKITMSPPSGAVMVWNAATKHTSIIE